VDGGKKEKGGRRLCGYVMLLVSVAVLDMPETSLLPPFPLLLLSFLLSPLSPTLTFSSCFFCLSERLAKVNYCEHLPGPGWGICTCHCNSELHRGWI
jgi:hypothetical protein